MALASPDLSTVEIAQRNAPKRMLRTLLASAITHTRLAMQEYDAGDRRRAREDAAVAAVYLGEALGRFAEREGP
jgi:hypothetical protein